MKKIISDQQSERRSIVEQLKPEEATEVLRQLMESQKKLIPTIESIAKSVCSDRSAESLAKRLKDDLLTLKICEIHERSKIFDRTYIEPTEAAWLVLKHTLEPYLEEMKRSWTLGLKSTAIEIGKGIVLGLFRARENKEDDSMLNWDPEFVEEESRKILTFWKNSGDESASINLTKFIEQLTSTQRNSLRKGI
jgi:hypothetical protein